MENACLIFSSSKTYAPLVWPDAKNALRIAHAINAMFLSSIKIKRVDALMDHLLMEQFVLPVLKNVQSVHP